MPRVLLYVVSEILIAGRLAQSTFRLVADKLFVTHPTSLNGQAFNADKTNTREDQQYVLSLSIFA